MSSAAPTPIVSLVILEREGSPRTDISIQSVLVQSRGDFELILPTRTTSGHSDPRIRFTSAPNNASRYSILRTAMQLARGRYVGWIDADDTLLPTALAETTAVLDRSPDIGWVYTRYQVLNKAGEVAGEGTRTRVRYSRDGLLTQFMSAQFRLMRKSAYDSVGGVRDDLSYAADYDLCLRLSETSIVSFVPKPLYGLYVPPRPAPLEERAAELDCTRRVIQDALIRRGMADEFELNMEYRARFFLSKRD